MPDSEKAQKESTPNLESSPTLTCSGCGARLRYLPGTRSLTCEYCGAENPIADTGASIDEMAVALSMAPGMPFFASMWAVIAILGAFSSPFLPITLYALPGILPE